MYVYTCVYIYVCIYLSVHLSLYIYIFWWWWWYGFELRASGLARQVLYHLSLCARHVNVFK
jgi:hypothetical protein